MNDTSHDMTQELSSLGASLTELGAALSQASSRLLEEGLLPTESLVEQIVGIRSELRSVRARICRLAHDRGIAVSSTASFDSIKAIESLFQRIKDAERSRATSRERTATPRSVVQRVLALRHDRLAEYAPLAACQERARAYLEAVVPDASEGIEASAEGLEPFLMLLDLVENRTDAKGMADGSTLRRVEEYFGRGLATAASAGAIVSAQRIRDGVTAPRAQPLDSQRVGRLSAELGLGLVEPSLSNLMSDGFNSASPWFSGLGRMPRLLADAPYRPTVTETVFAPAPGVRATPIEASAGATTPIDADLREIGLDPGDSAVLTEQEPQTVETSTPISIKEVRQKVLRGDSGLRGGSAIGDFLVFQTEPYSSGRSRKLGNAVRRRTHPSFEQLETLQLLSCSVISGFVYLDHNVDGLYDAGDTPIPNNTVQLYNASNQLVGTTTSDANGAYSFSTDSTISTATKTQVKSASVTGTTNHISGIKVPKFDPSLGTLTSVIVDFTGEIDSRIQSENTSVSSGDNITATLSGDTLLTGPGLSLDEPLAHAPLTANLSAFDGVEDFGGTSGVDFGTVTVSGTTSKTLSTAAGDDLSIFTGTDNYEGVVSGNALARVVGGGNLDSNVATSSFATLKFTYVYTPMNCLSPGQYTIVQPAEPPGTLDGRQSSNGVVLPYNPVLPNTIPVTLTNADSVNNNFGEILPGGLGGYVYVDSNKNGLKDPGEKGIPNVPIKLTGTNDIGQAVTLFTTTDGNGSYSFTGLRPGLYTTTETQQPAGYEDGKETRGNVVPIPNSIGTDYIPDIPVTAGNFTPNNNFGEIVPGTPGGEGGGVPPLTTVGSVEREGIHHQMTTIIVHFQGGLDPATANNTSNYHLRRIGKAGAIAHREIPLRSAVYNPANNTVTLTPVHRLNVHERYLLTIDGLLSNTNPPLPFDGDNNGTPGGTFVTVITRANYPHPLVGPGVIHQSLPARGLIATRSANPGLAHRHLTLAPTLGRGLSL